MNKRIRWIIISVLTIIVLAIGIMAIVNELNLHYKIEEIPGKLFKGKKYLIKTIEKEAVRNFIKEFINNLGTNKVTFVSTNINSYYNELKANKKLILN